MQKYYYYIGVSTSDGIVFVTSLNKTTKAAEWKTTEPPIALSKPTAEDISWGLFLNGYPAYVIRSHYRITKQVGVAHIAAERENAS